MNLSKASDVLRILSADMVEQAQSGHPGAPLGMADIATLLWQEFLKHNPVNPSWQNRDRFVLSNGHASALLYSLLHVSGYAVSIDDLKKFRQLHSITPGHPEYGVTPGVEVSTGPLGQGFAAAVGMAMAEVRLAAEFNKEAFRIVDNYTYVFAGDGCLMEGLSHEAAALAGHLRLNKLIVFWDDNKISIDGSTELARSDSNPLRFQSYGWQIIPSVDGHNPDAIREAIKRARQNKDQPTLICCKTLIAKGTPKKQGKAISHGAPLGARDLIGLRGYAGWKEEAFCIPQEIYDIWDCKEKGREQEKQWQILFEKYKTQYPVLASEYERRTAKEKKLPTRFVTDMNEYLQNLEAEEKPLATRKASQEYIESVVSKIPEIFAGSADLSASNLTKWKEAEDFTYRTETGRYVNYGIREFAMSAAMIGIHLYGGFIPYGGTFLVFMDYAKAAVRLAALMQLPIIYVYTHDSIAIGEDGPTHQPIEQLASLRMTPNLEVWRPCDAKETAIAWKQALIQKDKTSVLVFSRQNLAQLTKDVALENIEKGGYILDGKEEVLDLIMIATGSEVILAIEACKELRKQGFAVRVVSMPCVERFEKQDKIYQDLVLPNTCETRIAIEAGATATWYKYVGLHGEVIGVDSFGASGKGSAVLEAYGMTTKAVVKKAIALIDVQKKKEGK